MRAFLLLYQADFETKTGDYLLFRLRLPVSSREYERQAFTLLASVCSSWYYTLTGWPHSPTGLWVQHQLQKLIDGK